MRDEQRIREDLTEREEITFSELRKEYGLTYQEAKSLVDRLIEEEVLSYISGMTYAVKKEEEETATEDEYAKMLEKMAGLSLKDKELFMKLQKEMEAEMIKGGEWEKRWVKTAKSIGFYVEGAEEDEEDDDEEDEDLSEVENRCAFCSQIEAFNHSFDEDLESYEFDKWKELHKANDKNFSEENEDRCLTFYQCMQRSIRPEKNGVVTVLKSSGEYVFVELSFRADGELFCLSQSGIRKKYRHLNVNRMREIIKDYPSVQVKNGEIYVNVERPERMIGGLIDLCGALAALDRADD